MHHAPTPRPVTGQSLFTRHRRPLGALVTGDGEPYRYLVESIRQFPQPDAFSEMIREAGFARVSHRSLTGGIANIHSGWKL